MAYFFNSKLYIEPGADVVVDFDSQPQVSALSTSTCLVFAEATNGLDYSDKKIYQFSRLADAKSVLKGGPAIGLLSCIFNPSSNSSIPGASTVYFVRTNKGTNAKFQFSSGSVKKTQRYAIVTIASATPVGRVGFNLSINGSAKKSFVVDITSTLSDALNTLVAKVNETNGVLATLSGTTVVLTAVDNGVDFTISDALTPGNATAETSTTQAYSPEFIDALTIYTKDKGQNIDYSIKLSGSLCSFYSGNNLLLMVSGISTAQQLSDAITKSPVLSRVFTTQVTDGDAQLLGTGGIVPFKVFDDVATTPASFADALTLTEDLNKAVVFAGFEDEAYHTLLKNYVNNESTYGCIGFVGGPLGMTPTEVLARANNLNTEKIVECYPGPILNFTGESVTYPPVYFAAICAGLACGLEPQTPLTRKTVNVLGFEDIDFEGNSQQSVRESLIDGGVLFGRYLDGTGYVVNKGINTIQGQNNRQLLGTDNQTHEISIARIRIQIQKEFKVSADKTFPGTTRLSPGKTQVENFCTNYFNSLTGTYTTGWDSSSLSVRLDKDAWLVTARLYVNSPVNYFFATLTLALGDNA